MSDEDKPTYNIKLIDCDQAGLLEVLGGIQVDDNGNVSVDVEISQVIKFRGIKT